MFWFFLLIESGSFFFDYAKTWSFLFGDDFSAVESKIQNSRKYFLSHYFVLQQIPGKRKALTHNEKSYFPCTEELVNATTVVKLNTNVKWWYVAVVYLVT